MILGQEFYARDTLRVARDLIGKYLVIEKNGRRLSGMIDETEAYCGPHDLACHASKGKTARTAIMFGPAGYWYVYLIYGMYYCLNVVTENDGFPAAVLFRGLREISGSGEIHKTDGPGKLCRAFGIDKSYNTTPAFKPGARLWVEDRGIAIAPGELLVTPRIGVDYAGEYKDRPWRFLLPRKK